MKSGMLWFDNDPKKELQEKIKEAAEYFEKKYGIIPDECEVPIGMGMAKIGKINVVTSKLILKNSFLIGKGG